MQTNRHCRCEICQALTDPEPPAGPAQSIPVPRDTQPHTMRRYLVQVELAAGTRFDPWLFCRELARRVEFAATASSGGPIPRITITEES